MKNLFLFLLLFIPNLLLAHQPFELEHLKLQLVAAPTDSARIHLFWQLSNHYRKSNFQKGLEYADSAMILSEDSSSELQKAISYNRMGSLLFEIGLYNRSLENNLKSKRLYKKLGNRGGLVSVNHNIGAIYFQLGDYDCALNCFQEALNNGNKEIEQGDSSFLAQVPVLYNSIGNIYDQTDQNEKALSYYLEACEVAEKFKDHRNLGVIYNNLGKLSQEMGNPSEAYDYLMKSYNCRKKENDKNGLARSHNFLAMYHTNVGNYGEARKEAEKGLKVAEEIGSLFSQRTSTYLLYDVYKRMGNCPKALEVLISYNKISQKIFNEASLKDITRLQMEYDYKTKEEKRKAEQKRSRFINFILYGLLILGFLLFGLLYALVKERARRVSLEKKSLASDLEFKNKELTTNVMYLLKNTKVMDEAASTLRELQVRTKGDNKALLQQVIHDLQSASEKDVWEEFEIRFQQVHKEFFPNLKAKFPDLTPGELKLCSFLRLNMTTKEISSITHQNVKSIEVTRSRIRKKLNLTNTDVNLVSFLTEF